MLPTDDKTARELILGKTRYAVIDNVLYHLSEEKSLRIVVPQAERYFVFKEVHQGRFAGHLRDAKIHSQLSKAYWWPHISVVPVLSTGTKSNSSTSNFILVPVLVLELEPEQ